MSKAHTTDIIDHYTKKTSASANHFLAIEQQMESALFCFHFNMEVGSRTAGGLKTERLHD